MSRKKGLLAEDLAAHFLEQNGFEIIKRNYYSRFGEIDIIAKREGSIHFIEVKARATSTFGTPHESVTDKKLQKLIKTAAHYPTDNRPYQFDLLILEKGKIALIENITQ